jgi:hypothetical protein
MKKYCQNCGFENASKDKFCTKCGTVLLDTKDESIKQVEPIAQEIIDYKTPPDHFEPSKKKQPLRFQRSSEKMVLGLAAVAIVLSIAAISAAFLVKPTLGANSITTSELFDSSVTSSKIADGTITDSDISSNGISKIALSAITSNHIANNSILLIDLSPDVIDSITGLNVIANNSITGEKIANGAITSADLADESITSAKIVNGTISTVDIADGSITGAKITDSTITSSDLATDSVDSSEIVAGAVGTSELASGAVTYEKMAMKIRCGKATDVYNGSSIAHNLGSTPTSVVVTPIYDSSFGSGNATIYANIISVSDTSFTITLYVQYTGSFSPVIIGNPVDVYWIAIY